MAVTGKLFMYHYQVYPCSCLYLTAIGLAWHPCVSRNFSFSGLHSKKKVAEGKANGGDLHGLIVTATRKKLISRNVCRHNHFSKWACC